MADPIEIIQTVLTISKQIYDIVKSIQGAPDELESLEREAKQIQPILEHLVETLEKQASEGASEAAERSQGLCDEARGFIEAAYAFLDKVAVKNAGGSYRVRKTQWIWKASTCKDLESRFQKLCVSIFAFFSSNTHRGFNEFREEFDRGQHMIEEIISGQGITLQTVQLDVRESRHELQAHFSQQDEHHQQVLSLLYTIARSTMAAAAESQRRELNQNFDRITSKSSNLLLQSSRASTTGSTQLLDRGPNLHAYQDDTPRDRCPPGCLCCCHRPSLSLVPRQLRSVAGDLSVHHDWLSTLLSSRTPCDTHGCRRHRSNLLKIKYYCPAWFAQINAEIRTECLPVHFVIQTPRVVQKLYWLERATLDEVRQKLWSRELTVNDITPDGWSVLHRVTFRLTADRSDAALSIVALLTEHSAPTDWEYNGLTPAEDALWWSFVFWRYYGSRKAAFDALKHSLGLHLPQDIHDALEELATKLRWTGLHRLICLFSSPSLATIPPRLASQVNVKDSWGWTPLFYAALVNPDTIYALLAAGGNPRIDKIILSLAAHAGADTAINMLVRAGAYMNASIVDGYTALHWAANPVLVYTINGLVVALELVRHAGHLLDWNVRDEHGNTPLDWARSRVHRNPDDEDSKRILKLYQTRQLPDGAQYIPTSPIVDMEDRSAGDDRTGLPPTSLIRAGLRGDVDIIGDLISRGAMVNERDQYGRTLLHLVALGRVPDAYRIALELVRHGGWGVDWNASMGKGGPEDSDMGEDESKDEDEEHEAWTRKSGSGKTAEHDGEAKDTALEIAQARLDKNDLVEQEREELVKIRDLLQVRRLPPGESYLWPCMDPDFYESEPELDPEPIPRIPGAWNDD